jgi:probable HAF family extracellular repeat protein
MNKKLWPALVMVLLLVACWCHPAAAYVLKVNAWIDGHSQLIIQGNTVQWHNLSYLAPGYEFPYGDPPAPTYLSTKNLKKGAWTPSDWSAGISDDTTSGKFNGLNAPLAAVDQTVMLTPKQVRGTAEIIQQPAAANGYTLIVSLNDEDASSADWYEVWLDYIPGVRFQLLGQLEGMTGSQAYALNDKGQATGQSWRTGYSRAFFWNPKTKVMQELGTPAEWDNSRGDAINKKGQVAGYMFDEGSPHTHIFFWDPIKGMQDLENLGGDQAWVAWRRGISDKGQMCGSSETSPGGNWRAFFWDPSMTSLLDLGTLQDGTYSYATAINSKGQVVGYGDTTGGKRAFLWDAKNGMQPLGTLGGDWSEARDINSKGQVIGQSQTMSGESHGFLWDPKTKEMKDLGTLEGGTWSWPYFMNAKGQVAGNADTPAGERAFFWDPKTNIMEDLGTLGGTKSQAWSINKNGQVAGRTFNAAGKERGFLWDPKTKVMQDLGTLSGGNESGADDLNGKKQVAGYARDADGSQQAVIWTP